MTGPAKLIVGLLGLGVVAWPLYFYRGKLGLAGVTPSNEAANQSSLVPAQIDWQQVDRSQDDGFKVEMPVDTNETLIPAYDAQGGVEQVRMIMAMPGSDTFAVAWADRPPVERASSENAETTLDLARDGALTRTQMVLTEESHGRMGSYPERRFSARNDEGGILNARLILAGTHLYVLMAAFPAASARRDEDVNHFFDSFMLTSAPADR